MHHRPDAAGARENIGGRQKLRTVLAAADLFDTGDDSEVTVNHRPFSAAADLRRGTAGQDRTPACQNLGPPNERLPSRMGAADGLILGPDLFHGRHITASKGRVKSGVCKPPLFARMRANNAILYVGITPSARGH